ncbi:MAG: helix-turn-helix domain-containing protein [Planctomycetota bacterium]
MVTSVSSELLTRQQAAELLGVKSRTLAVWHCVHRYGIPLVKVGSRCMYRKTDLDRWLQSRTVGAVPAVSSPE